MQMDQAQTLEENPTALYCKKEKTKLIVAASIGNYLEIFDFTIYSFFAATIGKVFFVSDNPLVSLLLSFSIFAIGFVMRPLGSIVFGNYADKHGRKSALFLTITVMGLGSALIAFAPTYAMVGIYAPVIIIIGRLLQGFSAGGEIGAATSLLVESAPAHQRGFFASWQLIVQGISPLTGSLLAYILYSCLTEEQMLSFGWRIPFILSLSIIPVGLYIRKNIKETLDQPRDKAEKQAFKEFLMSHKKDAFLKILMMAPATIGVYILVFFIPHYINITEQNSAINGYVLSSFGSIMLAVTALCGGVWTDYVTRRKKLLFLTMLITTIASLGIFWGTSDFYIISLSYAVAVTALGLYLIISLVFLIESYERKIRATAAGVIYAFGVALFGGTAQMVVTELLLLTNNNPMAPYWYFFGSVIICMICLVITPERRYKK